MGLIERYVGYIGAPIVPIEVQQSPELRIAKMHAALSDELAQLRMDTVKNTYIDGQGNLKVNQTPAFTALQARILEKEQALEKLVQLAEQIDVALEQNGANSVYDLRERRAEHTNTVQSGPYRAWDLFVRTRGQGATIAEEKRTSWLPSDLTQVQSYKIEEDKIRASMEAAKAALEPISAALQRIFDLAAEAERLKST